MGQPFGVTEEEYRNLQIEVLAQQKYAGEALKVLFDSAERGQNLKLGRQRTRALAGFVVQLTEQNTHLANLAETAAQALEAKESKKKKLWRV